MSMIERVARRIAAINSALTWEEFTAEQRGVYFFLAREAIEAMQEPNEDMVERMQGALDCVPINRCAQQAMQVWQAGMHVALHGPGEG